MKLINVCQFSEIQSSNARKTDEIMVFILTSGSTLKAFVPLNGGLFSFRLTGRKIHGENGLRLKGVIWDSTRDRVASKLGMTALASWQFQRSPISEPDTNPSMFHIFHACSVFA